MPNATPGSIVAFADAPPAPAAGTLPGFAGRAVRLVRDDPPGVLAGVFLVVLALATVFAPALSPFDPARQLDIVALKTRPPSPAHWFGTDVASRDVLSRVLDGARVSLTVALLSVTLATLVGAAYGAVAGYARRAVDAIMMRTVDACLAIPRILLLLVVAALWGTFSASTLILLLGLTGWFGVSRLVRAEVVAVNGREFVAAARALGARPERILVRHVVPQVLTPVLVAATLGVGHLIVIEAGLSFLGYGIPQPRASWGSIIADGRDVLASAWWISLFPGLALSATVLALNVVADRLRQALNPRQLPGR